MAVQVNSCNLNMCRWSGKNCTKRKFLKQLKFSSSYIGFLAAFWSSLALCPTELVKCRLQAMRESHIEQGLEPPKIGPYQLTSQILR